MAGGIAVRGNLMGVAWSAAQGHVFLFDVEAQQRVSAWRLPPGRTGYCDAAGIAMDERYHVFVADPHNDRVAEFSAFGRHVRDYGAPAPPVGDAGRDRPGVLDRPHAVAVSGDVVLVACGDQPRRRGVQRFTRRGEALRPLAARGDVEAAFGAPRGLWADGAGIVVADTLRSMLQCFRGDGTFVRELACARAGTLARPVAVARRRDGSLLFVDRGDAAGVRTIAADGAPAAAGDLERCEDAIGIALDRTERVYVLDRLGERVLRFTPALRFDQVLVDLAERLDDAPRAT